MQMIDGVEAVHNCLSQREKLAVDEVKVIDVRNTRVRSSLLCEADEAGRSRYVEWVVWRLGRDDDVDTFGFEGVHRIFDVPMHGLVSSALNIVIVRNPLLECEDDSAVSEDRCE